MVSSTLRLELGPGRLGRLDRHRARVDGDPGRAEVEEPPGEHVGRARALGVSSDAYRSIAIPVIDRLQSNIMMVGDEPCARGDGDLLAHRAPRLVADARREAQGRTAEHREQRGLAVRARGADSPCRTCRCPRACSAWGSTTSQHASTSCGSSVVSCPVERGDVPAVDQHVEEAVAAVDRAGHRPVRHRDRRVHRPGRAERRRRDSADASYAADRVVAEHVAVEAVADVLDASCRRRARGPRGCPLTMWLTSARTSQSLAHRRLVPTATRRTPATIRRVLSSARAWTSGRSTAMRPPRRRPGWTTRTGGRAAGRARASTGPP